VAARAGRAAASGPARTAVAAAALTTVRRRGVRELRLWEVSEDLYRLVTADQVTDRYEKERANRESSPALHAEAGFPVGVSS
jgi:lysozyme family protein